MTAADDLKDKLSEIVNTYEELVKQNEMRSESASPSQSEESVLASHILNYPHRRYYLDLKVNRRGHFLRITMLSTSSRIKLAVPAEGIRELYEAIRDLLKTWWNRPPQTVEQKRKVASAIYVNYIYCRNRLA